MTGSACHEERALGGPFSRLHARAGATTTAPHAWLNWIYRWTLFRLMFGAGLIKLRGDACWRDLTCLDVFFETQPMPNPLSWYMHHLPKRLLHGGVAFNHFVELIVPFARENVVTACAPCNRLKGDMLPNEFFGRYPWAGANFVRYARAVHRALKRNARRAVSLALAA